MDAPADRATRRRLLEVATRQFAASGFRRTTVRAICREAHANVAAVNYHFHGKLGLYTVVLETAVDVMRDVTEAAMRAGEGLAPEDQLRAYIRTFCARIIASRDDSRLHDLMHREMAEPTAALATLVDRGLRPRLTYLAGIIGTLLGRPADDPDVLLCASSIHAQILMFRPNPIADAVRRRFRLPALTPDRVADHISRFSLAALAPFRRSQLAG